MRVLIADAFPEPHRRRLEELGHTCTDAPQLDGDGLPVAVADHDALIVRSTRVTEDALDASDPLGLVVRAGSGTDTIDLEAAARRGIFVCNVPGRNSIAVAELAFGLLLAIDRHIPDNVRDLRDGRWDKRRYSRARGLFGRPVGVVGLGDIGLEFARRATAFGMEVHAIDKDEREPEALAAIEHLDIRLVEDLATLARTCPILSFHVPANDETRGMIGRELLQHVPAEAVIINTSRGEIVDEAALTEAMDDKGVRAGLDVFRDEPAHKQGSFDSSLARHPNVYGTHHIGASTEQAQHAIADEVVAILRAFDAGEVRHCVNLETRPLGEIVLSIRHLDRVGVLSQVFGILRRAGINVEQMENDIFAGGRAACATMRVAGPVTGGIVAELDAVDEVIHVGLSQAPPPRPPAAQD
ncbi:MAG: ACT domain-containing protein [Actinobacteria bacterium]|nr:ACT domain-containing protein [Actinomycetota bacterium]